ncbi:MAG: Stf0 family sulfotransferase [Pseudomonadota bacterium]
MTDLTLSYTIWFSQRVGSTWLCDALAATGIAGRPAELLHTGEPADLPMQYGEADATGLLAAQR